VVTAESASPDDAHHSIVYLIASPNPEVYQICGAQVGIAYDAGFQLRLAGGALRLASAAQNLGSGPNYGGPLDNFGKVNLPTTYRFGMAAESRALGLLGTLEYRMLPESGEGTFGAGAEYLLHAAGAGFALRGGYEGASARIGGLSGFTLGGGLELGGLAADFAWLPQGALGNPYRMSLGWRFWAVPAPAGSRDPGPPPPLPPVSKVSR